MLSVSCSFPVPAETSVVAGRRRRRHRRRQRRGKAATVAPVAPAQATPASPSITVPPIVSTPQLVTPMQSPETAPPPVKKSRKRRNEVELLRDCRESIEILLSPPPSRGSPPSLPPSPPTPPLPASSCQPSQPTPPSDYPASETPELLTPELVSPLLEPTEPPEMPTTPPSTAPSPPSYLGMPTPATTVTSLNEQAATTIPDAPPMSTFFPSCSFKVICRYCLRDDHDVRYRQCPSCYKKTRWNKLFGMVAL